MAGQWLAPFAVIVTPLILMQVLEARSSDHEPVLRWPLPLRTGAYALIFMAILMFGEDGGQPFIYFKF